MDPVLLSARARLTDRLTGPGVNENEDLVDARPLARWMLNPKTNQRTNHRGSTMRRRELLLTAATGLAMVALPIGLARANHIRIDGNSPPAVQPVPAPASSQTIHADHITAQHIRADTIYANRIDADDIQGQIHHSKDVKVGDTRGEIKAPEVTASVIYAEEISANTVVAQNVYVRDLRRR